jgi:hypothetical protein
MKAPWMREDGPGFVFRKFEPRDKPDSFQVFCRYRVGDNQSLGVYRMGNKGPVRSQALKMLTDATPETLLMILWHFIETPMLVKGPGTPISHKKGKYDAAKKHIIEALEIFLEIRDQDEEEERKLAEEVNGKKEKVEDDGK